MNVENGTISIPREMVANGGEVTVEGRGTAVMQSLLIAVGRKTTRLDVLLEHIVERGRGNCRK